MLCFVTVVVVTRSANGHEVLYDIFGIASAHTPCVNVMYLGCPGITYFARDKVGDVIAKKFEIDLGVFLH